ncbi:hypothetical protein DFH27DRAFT_608317 [Peziza echinospora]|nr:hypothetical protein DFH27DRAFT_608317 [Peziza echinospora]
MDKNTDWHLDVVELPQRPLHPPHPPPHISHSNLEFPPWPGHIGDPFVLATSNPLLFFNVPTSGNFNTPLYEICTTTYSSSSSPSFHNRSQQTSFQGSLSHTSLAQAFLHGRIGSDSISISTPAAAGNSGYQFHDSHLPYSSPPTSLYHHITRYIYSASGHTTTSTTGTTTKVDSMDVYALDEPLSLVINYGGGTNGASASAMAPISDFLLTAFSPTFTTTTTSITKAIDIGLEKTVTVTKSTSQLETMFPMKPSLSISTTTANSLGAGGSNTPPLSPLSQPSQSATTNGSTVVHAEYHTEQEKKKTKRNVFSYMEDFFLEKVLPEFKRRQGRTYSYRYKPSSVAVKEATSTVTTAPESTTLAPLTIQKNKAAIPSFLRRCRKTPPSVTPPTPPTQPHLLPTLHKCKSNLPVSRSKITKKIYQPFTWRRSTRALPNHKQACTTWEVDTDNDVIMCDAWGRTDLNLEVDCLDEEMDVDCDNLLEEI